MMTFQKKIFIAILLVSSVTVSAVLFVTYRIVSDNLSKDYHAKYQVLISILSETIETLEAGTEDTMRVALQALKYFANQREIPSNQSLQAIQRNLRVSIIEFVNSKGQFIRSTKYDVGQLPNLFSFCDGYRELFTGESDFDHTPLMPSIVDHHVYKFALVPTFDRKHVINVGMEINYLSDLFKTVLSNDQNLLKLRLLTPTGVPVASFIRDGSTVREVLESAPESEIRDKSNSVKPSAPRLQLNGAVGATNSTCCECVGKGLVKASTDPFFYRLSADVSFAELNSSINRLGKWLTFIAVFGLVLAVVFSRSLASHLSRRLVLLTGRIKAIQASGTIDARLEINGKDEFSELGAHFDKLLNRLKLSQEALISAEQERVLARVSSQVAHDVRSPLAALQVLLGDLNQLPEERRILLRNAISRIRDIVNNLLFKTRELKLAGHTGTQVSQELTSENRSVQLLTGLVDSIVSEKREQYRGRTNIAVEIDNENDGYGLFACVQPTEFKRVISNLINNGVEAIQGEGRVSVALYAVGETIHLVVSDNGKGITPEDLVQIKTGNGKSEKVEGLGLGLRHAFRTVENWEGKIDVESTLGAGCRVTMLLPKEDPPEWFLPKLTVNSKHRIVLIDDDISIRDVWKNRLSKLILNRDLELIYFLNPIEARKPLEQLIKNSGTLNLLLLVDYEFIGCSIDGIEFIKQMNASKFSILETSHLEDIKLRRACEELKIKAIPKSLAPLVPIDFRTTRQVENQIGI